MVDDTTTATSQEKQPDAPAQAEKKAEKKESPSKGVPREKRQSDDPVRVLARRAIEIAEAGGAPLGSSITAPQAQIIKDRLGPKPGEKFPPASLHQLQEYAQGGHGTHRDGVPPEAIEKIRAFCRATESRRIWPRKVAAMVLALEEQRTGHVRPNTKRKAPEPEKEPEKAK
jgi:hypothetical protein